MKEKWSKAKIAITVFLSLSLLLNFAGGYLMATFYGLITQSTERRASVFDSSPAFLGPDVIMLGDSITHEGLWSELFPNYRILNRGISGDTTTDLVARLPQIYQLKPQAIFVMIGINDLIQRVDDETTRGNYQKIFDRLGAHLPDTKIYLQSVLPVREDWPFAPEDKKIRKLNRILEAEAIQRQYVYINLWDTMATEHGELRQEFTNDGVHLMGSAYRAWSDQIRPYVQVTEARCRPLSRPATGHRNGCSSSRRSTD